MARLQLPSVILLLLVGQAVAKGCFRPLAEVTLADGQQRPLAQISPGDSVLSWDETLLRPAVSKVRAVPKFLRRASELLVVDLPEASFVVTEEHPLWSSRQGALVSKNPNATLRDYGLQVELALDLEQLEGEQQENVSASFGSFRALRKSLKVEQLEVMTLCLEPHHWFYVHGVRVHNKGCFEESALITMADGSSKKLGDVAVGDQVISYDEAAATRTVSTVRGAPVFLREHHDLVQLALGHVAFNATADHPFYSARKRGLVSADPLATMASYNLSALQLEEDDLLEDEEQRPVPIRSLGTSRLQGRRLRGAEMVRVKTLCLEPHHWFFVHGVRVHNKGCFLGTADVTMADGTRRPLQNIKEGDLVASYDEALKRRAVSTVRAVPRFQRNAEELLEIRLPNATFDATDDHPFWSRGRSSLVAASPNKTFDFYTLKALPFQEGELLEDEAQQGVPLVALRQSRLVQRRLRSTEPDVSVLTLCLEPHHWFYVHGVRVHNKGCFAPWTPVAHLGGEKPIGEVQVNDYVLSWDEDSGRLTEAKVVGIDVVQPSSLYELVFPAFPEEASARRLGPSQASSSLVLTHDHPIFSARAGGLVSRAPSMTSAQYGLDVGMMDSPEVLQHYNGSRLEATLRDYEGNVSEVMTLRLDKFHWFYASGVRVHNKGGGFGGFGASRRRIGSSPRRRQMKIWAPPTSKANFSSPELYAFWLVANTATRRRYGTYHPDPSDGCNLLPENEIKEACRREIARRAPAADPKPSWPQATLEPSLTVWDKATCEHTSLCCMDCIACTNQSCVEQIYNCAQFLADIHVNCSKPMMVDIPPGPVTEFFMKLSSFLGIAIVGGGALVLAWQSFVSPRLMARKLRLLTQDRQTIGGSWPFQVAQLQLNGSYTENGETKPCHYMLYFTASGQLRGTGHDDDGTAQVLGVVGDWNEGLQESTAKVRWEENRPGATMEVTGSMFVTGGPFDPSSFRIAARYVSSYDGTHGTLEVETPPALGNVPLSELKRS